MTNETVGRRKRNMPTAYIFMEHEDGSIHLQDGQCIIMTKEKMLDMVYGMMKFIENEITDNDIEKENDETFEEMMIEMAGADWKNQQPNLVKSNSTPTKKREGWVYFLKADNGLIKIGRTNNLDKRIYHFTTKLPYKLELIHFIKTDCTVKLENELHNKFDHLRVRGEWFNLNDEIMAEIRGAY